MNDTTADNTTSIIGKIPPRTFSPADLRVVLLADEPSLRGYGPALRRLAVGLLDDVGDLSILSLTPDKMLDYVPSPPVRVITEAPRCDFLAHPMGVAATRLGLTEHLLPHRRVARLAERLAPAKPTLLHALSESISLLTRRLSKQLRIPYVVSLLSTDPYDLKMSSSNHRCGAVLTCSSAIARHLRRHDKALASRVHLLPIGTHISDKPCCFSEDRKLAHIFCCNDLEYGGGLSVLINSIKRLSDLGHRVQLTLSGQGSAEHDLRRQVKQLQIAELVNFVPPFDSMILHNEANKLALQSADIFVQSSPAKIWRPELLEAMSVGNAVVAAGNQYNDLIVKDKTALVVPFLDEKALTAALQQLLNDHPCALSLAAAAQQYLRKHFLASHMVTRLARAYRQALTLCSPRI